MRCNRLILLLLLPLLVACKLLPQGTEQPPPAASQQDGVGEASQIGGDLLNTGTAVRPKPRPLSLDRGTGTAVEPNGAKPSLAELPLLVPAVEKSKEQVTCEKRGGNWGNAGKSKLKTCIRQTRDAGKQCRKQGDCDSACLARSRTCAPIKPLFGCNEILQKDGSRATVCID